MGNVFNIVGCECSKNHQKSNSIHKVRVSDSTSSELISSTIIPKELYKDETKKPHYQKYITKSSKDYNVLDKYTKICEIGRTHYSTVYKAQNKLNNEFRALKEIPKENIENSDDTKNIVISVGMLRGLEHPNLIKLYEFYEDEKNYYIINELCDEIDLDEILKERILLCEFLVKFIMYKIFSAVNYLHKQKIIHGNIKITNVGIVYKNKNNNNENINNNEENNLCMKDLINIISDDESLQKELLREKYFVFLSDKAKLFLKNLSKYEFKLLDCWSQDIFIKNQSENDNSDIILNINYLSPELFDGYIVKERDEWACGILMFNLIKGYYPFDGDSKEELVLDIVNGNDSVEGEIKNLNVSNECKDLLLKLLERKINNRIKVEDVFKHDFFQKGIKIQDLSNLDL